jgi:hypothetical protein
MVTYRVFLTKININSPTNKLSQAAVRIPATSHMRHNIHPATAHNRVEHTLWALHHLQRNTQIPTRSIPTYNATRLPNPHDNPTNHPTDPNPHT